MTYESYSIRSDAISAVVALVRDEDGRVLLASTSSSGPWSCIGGALDDDEGLVSGAVRFASEDCGLEIEVGEVVAKLAGDAYRVLYECGADVTYQATVVSAAVVRRSRRSSMLTKWFTTDELATTHLDEFAVAALTELELRRG